MTAAAAPALPGELVQGVEATLRDNEPRTDFCGKNAGQRIDSLDLVAYVPVSVFQQEGNAVGDKLRALDQEKLLVMRRGGADCTLQTTIENAQEIRTRNPHDGFDRVRVFFCLH